LISTFDATTGGAVGFTGDSTKFLQVESNTALNMGSDSFTISWWQQSSETQTAYPRILQFGHGAVNQSNFAISEEVDGNIYLWINGMNITSMANPNPGDSNWHHIAIIREGTTFRWFLDGGFVSLTENPNPIAYDTSGLDLLIGAGDDVGNGAFTGNLAGLQISKSVRWESTTAFTPPTDFLNPGLGLAFSMYVSETEVSDKSGSNHTVAPIVLNSSDFTDFAPTLPSPTPTPSPSASADLLSEIVQDTGQGWDAGISIYKSSSSAPFDYRTINTVTIGIPLTYYDSSTVLQKTKCYINIAGKWNSYDDEISLNLDDFDLLSRYTFPDTCQTAPSPGHPSGYLDIPDYTPGLFGTDEVRLDFLLWREVISGIDDISDVSGAYEKLVLDVDLPPEMLSYSIDRGPSIETDTTRISFGDTITVTVWNETATVLVKMVFAVPEAKLGDESSDPGQWCEYPFAPDTDGEFGRTFALPTLEDLVTRCRTQYSGTWEFDSTVDRSFYIAFVDASNAGANITSLTLNAAAQIDWSLYPSSIGTDTYTWNTTATFNNEIGDPQYDYRNTKHVSIGLPITYLDSTSATVNVLCHFQLPDEIIDGDSRNLEIDLPEFSVIANNLKSLCGDEIPSYRHGMLGESQTVLTFYLWTHDLVADYELFSNAFEAIPVTLDLPPQVTSYAITRGAGSESDSTKIYSGDSLTVNMVNQDAFHSLAFTIAAPESKQIGMAADPLNTCYFQIYADSNGTSATSFVIPSAQEISAHCHTEYDGDWNYDLMADRLVVIDATDIESNGFLFNGPMLKGTPTPTPPTPTPPTPTPPTPTPPTPEPVAPTVEIKAEVVIEPKVAVEPEVVIEPVPVDEQLVTSPKEVEKRPIESETPLVTIPLKSEVKAKQCAAKGVWIFTKSGLLQLCDEKLNVVLAVKACTGKSTNPTFPWVFKAQRFKPGYSQTQSRQKLYYSVFFFKGLAIAGIDKVSNAPCSNGSVFIEKKYAKQVYSFIKLNNSAIWVKNS
jgi:hypothetical protein